MARQPEDEQSRAKRVPEAIRKHAPQPTLEMKGPIGAEVRRARFEQQAARDISQARAGQERNLGDKRGQSLVVSKKNAQEQTRGLLKKEFDRAKATGQARTAFNKASSRDRGR